MASTGFAAAVMLAGSLALMPARVAPASEIAETVDRIAGRLQTAHVATGPSVGNWQVGFNGSIVAGMLSAYEYTGNEAYAAAARRGGNYILYDAESGLFGDDAYALMRLSQCDKNPDSNPWRTVLTSFYQQIRDASGGTLEYVGSYREIDPSTAVFYLAHHAVAAHYVHAEDEGLWRSTLIRYLSQVDDAVAEYPVMALGVATWALAQTGPLDETPIGDGSAAVWKGLTLADLPTMLLSHQVPAGQENAGTFYWRFDHQNDGAGSPAGGYTEDAVFAVLGLTEVSRSYPDFNVEAAVGAVRDALLNAADAEGNVHATLAGEGLSHPAFGGELLQALPQLDAEWAIGK